MESILYLIDRWIAYDVMVMQRRHPPMFRPGWAGTNSTAQSVNSNSQGKALTKIDTMLGLPCNFIFQYLSDEVESRDASSKTNSRL